jgi:hypothetical protein
MDHSTRLASPLQLAYLLKPRVRLRVGLFVTQLRTAAIHHQHSVQVLDHQIVVIECLMIAVCHLYQIVRVLARVPARVPLTEVLRVLDNSPVAGSPSIPVPTATQPRTAELLASIHVPREVPLHLEPLTMTVDIWRP